MSTSASFGVAIVADIGRGRRLGAGEGTASASLAHGQQPDAIGRQQHTADPGHPEAGREQLFDQHHGGQDGDPQQVHHAAREQQRHQNPAAAEAIETVAEAHVQGAGGAVPPVVDDEIERRPADSQAGLLERRQLVEAGGEEQQAAPAARWSSSRPSGRAGPAARGPTGRASRPR
jgi:hypothetical protein